MSVYNGEQYLNQAIESILNQSFIDFEFIIINDGSTDNSWEVIQEYSESDKRIVPFTQNNIGLTKSLNKGISLSKGQYVARQDADDWSTSDRLYKQLNFITGTKHLLVASHYNIYFSEYNITVSEQPDLKLLDKKNTFCHGSLFFNRSAFKHNLYNEDIPFAQDYDLIKRIYKNNSIGIINENLYTLRRDKPKMSEANKFLYYKNLNKYKYALGKYYKNNNKLINKMAKEQKNYIIKLMIKNGLLISCLKFIFRHNRYNCFSYLRLIYYSFGF